jgi:hypothetical protein
MTKGFVCELCQLFFSSKADFYKHLDTHSRREVLELKKIAEKKLQMTSEQEKDFDFELMKEWLKKKQQHD